MGEQVDLETRFKGVLDATEKAVGAVNHIIDDDDSEKKEAPEPTRRILVHCDAGVNRSPTIVLAVLVRQFRLPLREAYKLVLKCRDGIDPVPAYRRALRSLDKKYQGKMSITGNEFYAMHITEVMKVLKS